MGKLHRILLSVAVVVLFSLIFFIVFTDNGLLELYALKRHRQGLIESNARMTTENLSLYNTIDRLKYDSGYIETVAKKELGMIGKDEIIIKFAGDGKTKSNHE